MAKKERSREETLFINYLNQCFAEQKVVWLSDLEKISEGWTYRDRKYVLDRAFAHVKAEHEHTFTYVPYGFIPLPTEAMKENYLIHTNKTNA